jgi:hypothetical protein
MALVAQWPLAAIDGSGNTPDASGNGWTGAVKPTYPTDCPAVGIGPCPAIPAGMDFNGSSHYVNVGRPHMVGNVYSISAWFKTSAAGALTGSRYTIYSAGNNGICPVLSTSFNSQGGFEITTPGVFDENSSPNLITLGKWHHIVYSRASSTKADRKFYYDGAQVGMALQNDRDHVNCSADCTIGSRAPAGGSQLWPGSLADVRLYSHALSAAEVYAIYEAFVRDNAQLLGLLR